MRSPPKHIEVLLPVWGERYTRDFLDFSLPSLLAPGNLPSLSGFTPCTFVLLAPARDAQIIQDSPLWAVLQRCCSVRIAPIDDLISQASSIVLTLAYALAIRESADRILDTCFIPLVADYVVADGSLRHVAEQIFSGASGVLAGNFQIARDAALPLLRERKNQDGVLPISPRSLVLLSLGALHQATLGEIINEGRGVRLDANRLFWRVDEHCLVGRFFLMHMIAIHPEISDFVISAPSDYCLIPELCPSGNIVRLTDSDDYFVVECQPAGGLPQPKLPGLIDPSSFARSLGSWATALHRSNVAEPLLFHVDDVPSRAADAVSVSGRFIAEVESKSSPALPFRHHLSWRRTLDYHFATAQQPQNLSRLAAITGDRSLFARDWTSAFRSLLLGRAPHFRPWHTRWPDVQMLKRYLASSEGQVAFVSDASANVRDWFDRTATKQGATSTSHFRLDDVPDLPASSPKAGFDCLFVIMDRVPADWSELLSGFIPIMKPAGAIVVCVGEIFAETTDDEWVPVSESTMSALGINGVSAKKLGEVALGTWRQAIQTAMMRHARTSVRLSDGKSFYGLTVAGGLAAVSMLLNMAAVWLPSRKQRFSSLFYRLHLTKSDSTSSTGPLLML